MRFQFIFLYYPDYFFFFFLLFQVPVCHALSVLQCSVYVLDRILIQLFTKRKKKTFCPIMKCPFLLPNNPLAPKALLSKTYWFFIHQNQFWHKHIHQKLRLFSLLHSSDEQWGSQDRQSDKCMDSQTNVMLFNFFFFSLWLLHCLAVARY